MDPSRPPREGPCGLPSAAFYVRIFDPVPFGRCLVHVLNPYDPGFREISRDEAVVLSVMGE